MFNIFFIVQVFLIVENSFDWICLKLKIEWNINLKLKFNLFSFNDCCNGS